MQKHIIDILIEERAPKLAASIFWPIIKPVLNLLLGYKSALKMANAVEKFNGRQSFEYLSNLLSLKVSETGIENIPKTGKLIIICNHPTGIADGIALYDIIKKYRPDLYFYANADAKRVCDKINDIIIPVEWVYEKRTREKTRQTLAETHEVLNGENCLAIFPAGRLGVKNKGKLIDPEWMATPISLARKYNCPILPIYMEGPDSFWFHLFDKFSKELRDITLFHEFLNKAHKKYDLFAGKLIYPDELVGNNEELIAKLKNYVEFEIIKLHRA